MQSATEWAQLNFGTCDLGDKRRTKRLVKVAEELVTNPSASLPNQIGSWSGLKAAYRLFDCDQVTFDQVARPHWELTKARKAGRCLVIGDTTEISFRRNRKVAGLGPTGNGSGRGFLLHNALLVDFDGQEIVGIAGQAIHYRKPKTNKKETSTARLRRDRESLVWGKVIDQVGPPPQDVEWVHIFDRAADNFETYCHLILQRGEWVIRASRMNRHVLVGEKGKRLKLSEYLPELKSVGTYTLRLRTRNGKQGREAKLTVRVGRVKVPPPRHKSPWVKKLKQPPIPMNVIEVIEEDPPKGEEPIRWVLFTSLPVKSFEDARMIIRYYETRWLIEEFHKALKTGCGSESRQLKSAGRLEAFIGLTSVIAVRLLQLKSIARHDPDVPAKRVVPNIWLQMLKLARKGRLKRVHDLTVRQFYREVAMLGGFLGRKGDGEPGWITIWRGWEKLSNYVTAAYSLRYG